MNLFLCECDFKELYEAIVECLGATGVNEVNGNSKTITAAYRMMKRIGDSAFFLAFNQCNIYLDMCTIVSALVSHASTSSGEQC